MSGSAMPVTRRGVRWWVVALVVAVILGATGGYLWITRPNALAYGNEVGLRVTVGQTGYTDLALYSGSRSDQLLRIAMTEISPRITVNSSDATLEILACTRSADTPRIGAVTEDIRAYCNPAVPFTSGSYTINGSDRDDVYLIAAVTPARAGKFVMKGIDISYTQGIRRGFRRARRRGIRHT